MTDVLLLQVQIEQKQELKRSLVLLQYFGFCMSVADGAPCGQTHILHVASMCVSLGLPCSGCRLPAGTAQHRSSQYGQTGGSPAQIQTSTQLIPATVTCTA